jgi:hypothetical protein
MRARKPGLRVVRNIDPEQLSTREIVDLHERLCAPLDAAARSRIIDGASRRGWDRTWDMDSLAA